MVQAHPQRRAGRVIASSLAAALSFLTVCNLPLSSYAATYTWDGSASNDWATPANWSGNVVPPAGGNRISIGVTGTTVTFANRAIYSATQGTQVFTGTGASDSNRGLFIGNGAGISGYFEINGGVFESQSSQPDGMGNGGASATLWINGGTYRKITGSGAASTFALVFTGGNSLLDIDAGRFEATTLDFQNSGGTATTTGTVQLDGGVLSVANFAKTNITTGAAYAMNLNGGTLQARADATWADISAVTWTVQSNSVIDTQGFSVTLAEALGGAGGITKVGAGTLTLSGANSFAGGLVIKAGTVSATTNTSALGGSAGAGAVTLGDSTGAANATLLGDARTFANPIVVAAGNTGTMTIGNSGTSNVAFSGGITLNKDLTLASNSTGTVIVSGPVSGANNLTITGNGTGYVQLGGTNTGFTGDVTISSGMLRMGSTTALGVNNAVTVESGAIFRLIGINTTIGALSGSGTVENFAMFTPITLTVGGDNTSTTFSGVFQNGNVSNLSVNKVGTGTLTLQGGSTYGGSFTISAGTVKLDFAAADSSKLSDTGVLVLAGGTLELSGGSHVDAVASTTLSASTASTISRTSGNAVLEMNDITVNSGATLNILGNSIATTNNRNTNGILGGWATVTIGGVTTWAANATDTDDGAIVAYSGYTDITRLAPSVMPKDPTANVRIVNGGTAGPITLAASPVIEINTLQMDASAGPATVDPANATDILRLGEQGGILQTSNAGGLNIGSSPNDGVLTSGGADTGVAATLNLVNESSSNDLTVNSVIANNGSESISVVKDGAGRLVLSGANTFTGTVRINRGTVLVGSVAGANTTGTLGAGTSVVNNGSLVIRRTDTTLQDVAGGISGTGSVSYLGSGVSEESQYNVNNGSTYTGGTLIDDARVTVASTTGLGTNTVTVSDGGQLYVATASLANNLVITGNGWTEAAGNLGAIRFNTASSTLSGTVTLAGNSRITSTNGITGFITGGISGAYGIEIGENSATGTVVFSGDNSYTGVTTVSFGALRAGSSTALGTTDGGTIVSSGARVELANGVTVTGEAITLRGNGGNNFGALQAAANATATWDGPVTIAESGSRFAAQTGGSLTIKGNINGGGFNSVVVRTEHSTTSVVTLEGSLTNMASGGTFAIFNGVVKLGAAERLQNDLVVQLGTSQAVALAGTLDLNGFNETIARLNVEGTVTATQIVTNSSAMAATLTLSSSTNSTYNHLFSGNLALTKQGSNTLTLGGANTHRGDTLVSSGTLALANVNALQESTLDTGTSGSQSVTFTVAGTNTYNLGGLKGADNLAMGTNSLSVGANHQDTVYSGSLSGNGGLAKVGNGTLTLAGANGYTGATFVTTGTLQVGNNGSGSITSALTVNNGGALAGSGTISASATINNGAVLRPGDSAGAGFATLTFSGASSDLSMGGAGAEFEFRAGANGISFANQSSSFYDLSGNLNAAYTLAGNLVGGANDRVVVGDEINLMAGGVIDFDFQGYVPNAGDGFDLLDWLGVGGFHLNGFNYGSVSGVGRYRTGGAAENALFDLDLPALSVDQQWDMSLFESHGVIVVVPEPSRALLVFMAFGALFVRRRR